MASHPVEVVGRIREHPDGGAAPSAVTILGKSVRLRCEQGYRDFALDGVSAAGGENLRAFYKRYVENRVEDVRSGGKCTVMMYGPTGAGKSHTMFGSAKENGVAYMALHQIMRSGKLPASGLSEGNCPRMQVTANVLEIYNEEVYDLLASNCISSPGPKSLKPMLGRARLEVRGRKVKNATCISGADPAKLVQEIANVEKRRVIKSTTSNSRSSRSHCMVILDVAGVGGRLILVDMAGSENSDQTGSEAKLQTGKINQGNAALKRVVECIANGDTHIPYRDSKLTMLLQDSFELDGAKILMVLCASPEPRDAYKTICTFEYGAKAKCIVRMPFSPPKETATFADGMEAVLLARLQFKDECIERLRQEFEQKERERAAKAEELSRREQELNLLQQRAEQVDEERRERMAGLQKQMDRLVHEKSEELRKELELELQVRVTKICPENSRFRVAEMERLIENQRQEIAVLRLRAERAESELVEFRETSEPTWTESNQVVDMDISNSICVSKDFTSSAFGGFAAESYASPPPGPMLNEETLQAADETPKEGLSRSLFGCGEAELPWSEIGLFKTGWLPIIPEEGDEASNELPRSGDEAETVTPQQERSSEEILRPSNLEEKFQHAHLDGEDSSPARSPPPEKAANRKSRIENIFLLCGNHREVAAKERYSSDSAPSSPICSRPQTPPLSLSPLNLSPLSAPSTPTGLGKLARFEERRSPPDSTKATDVYVKWESTKSAPGKILCAVHLPSTSCLADLRTEIGLHVLSPSDFHFLILGDVGGAPVDRDAESALLVSSLPPCSDNPGSRLACLRAAKSPSPSPSPFKAVQNQIGLSSPVLSRPRFCQAIHGEENVDPLLLAV